MQLDIATNACIAGCFRSAKSFANSHSSPEGACWMRRNRSLRPPPAPGEAPPFSFARYFAFREVCTMKLSHFRGSLQCTNNTAFGPR
jgi:hypothetical protein